MATSTVTPPAAGSAAPPAGTGAGAGSGAGTGAGDSGAGGAGDGKGTPTTPTKLNITFGDGEAAESFDLSEEAAVSEPEFKFEQLDAIKESNADLYKAAKAELSKAGRFGKVGEKIGVKSPEDFKSHVERIDKLVTTIGRQDGKVGLDALEATIGELANTLVNARKGEFGNWFEKDPASLAGAAAKLNEQWEKTDAAGYNAHIAQKAWGALAQKDAAGFSAVDALNALYDIPAIKNDPQAQKLLQRAAYTLNQISQQSEYKPDATLSLKAKEEQIAAREAKVWQDQTDLEVTPIIRTAARKGLSSLVSELKRDITPEERAEYLDTLETSFYQHAQKDTNFATKLNELAQKLDREGIKDLVKTSKNKYMTAALKDLYKAKLLDRKAIRDEAAGKGEANGGGTGGAGKVSLQYSGKMKYGAPDVAYDYARMKAEDPNMLENHEFYIVGKKERMRW